MKTCYMCEAKSTSVEHVPPKCLFPEQKDLPSGVDLRKHPACDEHNSKKSKDDEYLLYCLAMSLPADQIGNDHFLCKVRRAIKRNPNLINQFQKSTERVVVENINTSQVSDTTAFQADR